MPIYINRCLAEPCHGYHSVEKEHCPHRDDCSPCIPGLYDFQQRFFAVPVRETHVMRAVITTRALFSQKELNPPAPLTVNIRAHFHMSHVSSLFPSTTGTHVTHPSGLI